MYYFPSMYQDDLHLVFSFFNFLSYKNETKKPQKHNSLLAVLGII